MRKIILACFLLAGCGKKDSDCRAPNISQACVGMIYPAPPSPRDVLMQDGGWIRIIYYRGNWIEFYNERELDDFYDREAHKSPAPHKKSSDEAFAELMIQPCSAVMKTGTIAFAVTFEQSVEWGHKLDTCVQESSR